MTTRSPHIRDLQRENKNLLARVEEAEETLRAIQNGEVDALVVSTDYGEQVFTLEGADRPFRVLIENMSEGALTITGTGVILYANQRFAEMLKIPLEKVIGSSIIDWIKPADRDNFQAVLHKEDGKRRLAGLDLVDYEGALIPAQLSLINLQMDMPDNIAVVVTDLTERNMMEEIINAEWLAQVKMEETERSKKALLSLIEEQKQTEEALQSSKQQLAAELKAVELLQRLSMQLIQADNVEDLYNQILDTATALLRSDFASLQLFHPERGREGELQLLGHRGFSQDAAMFWKWICPDSRSTCGKALRENRRVAVPDVRQCSFMSGSVHLQMCHENGIRAVQTTPLISRSGRLLGVVSTHWRQPHKLTESEIRSLDLLARQAADLIERTQAEEALASANKDLREANLRKDEFMGALSHEIRNPLTSITLGLSMLERTGCDGEKAKQAREIMGRQVSQLSRLVDDLLDVTRITRNLIVLKKEPVELNSLVSSTVKDHRALFEEKGVELKIQLAVNSPYVEADPTRLSQVLGNLLHNAVKFTGAGGTTRITLSVDEPQGLAVIRVEDNGIGMSKKMVENLFKPFIQADASLDRCNGGLGLGLALIKGLVKLHGGTVEAHSGGLGKGSVFTVNLPLSAKAIPAKQKEPWLPLPCRKKRILVIEDISDVAEVLRCLLLEDGHEVQVAFTGTEGISTAREFQPDVVLCDIGLPGIDGYQVARAFGDDEGLKNVTLISLTGYARPEDIERSKEAGFHFQLSKPVDLETLKKTLDRVK